MTMTFGPDENRAVEAIAALLEIFPRLPGEDDDGLAFRMADWGLLQGPNIRWDALQYAARTMVSALSPGMHYVSLAEIGMRALNEYNQVYPRQDPQP